MVIARTAGGDIAFLTGHAPFVGALGIGKVVIRESAGTSVTAAVHGGFVEVKDNRVTILSDVAELSDQIDVERAREAERRAEERLRLEQDAEAEAALRRAHVRLDAAGGTAVISH
jgi:F-type H+-transporting ATPase subunit epsilon